MPHGRSEWPRFAASFSREHDEWVASLQVDNETTLEERPFHGITVETRPGRETAILIFGDAASATTGTSSLSGRVRQGRGGTRGGAKIEFVKKPTIKPAAGTSRVSPETAYAAARFVYRTNTGKFIISKTPLAPRSRKVSSSVARSARNSAKR